MALFHIDINTIFESHLDKFKRHMLEKSLKEVDADKRENSCLVHLFTGRNIFEEGSDEATVNGIGYTGGIFDKFNVGATSVANCATDPWQLRCLLTFAHELGHNMGANHDSVETGNLMSQQNDMTQPPEAANLVSIIYYF